MRDAAAQRRENRIRAWRLAGQLVCGCPFPKPQHIPLFGGYECRLCRRPYFAEHRGTAEELVRLTLDVVDGLA